MQQQIYYSLTTALHMHHQSTKPIPLLIRLTHASSIYQSDPSPNIIVSVRIFPHAAIHAKKATFSRALAHQKSYISYAS